LWLSLSPLIHSQAIACVTLMLLQSSSISKEGGAELCHSRSRLKVKVFDVSASVLDVEAVMKGVEMCGCASIARIAGCVCSY